MKTNVCTRIGDTTDAMKTIAGEHLNDRLKEVLRRTNIIDTLRTDYTLTTTAGTQDYVLPQDFNKDISVVDSTSGQELSRINSQDNVMLNAYGISSQGAIRGYIILDKLVFAQPTSSSTITFYSSSTLDTTQNAYVRGFDANGYEDYEQVLLGGQTTVTTTKSFSRIISISKSGSTYGTVTATSNSGLVTLAVMSRAMTEHRVKVIRFVDIPNGSFTVTIYYLQNVLPMSQDNDFPILDCPEVLEAGAEADVWRFKRQFGKAADLDVIFEKRLANLLFDYENQPNKLNLFKPMTYSHNINSGNITDSRYGIF